MKRVLVLLAEGFEEVEALSPVDYLRRANLKVATVSLGSGLEVQGARGITVKADILFDCIPDCYPSYEALVIPGGGPGTEAIASHRGAIGLIRDAMAAGLVVGAICAAPAIVLGKTAGLLDGRRFTCYPGLESKAGPGSIFVPQRVVVDGTLITSRAAGTSGEFALALIASLCGQAQADSLAASLLINP